MQIDRRIFMLARKSSAEMQLIFSKDTK